MKLAHLWRKPSPTEVLQGLIDDAESELQHAEMVEVLSKAKLNTATASVAFYRQHVLMLKDMLPKSGQDGL